MIEINRSPSKRELLIFAWILPVFFGLVGVICWRAGWSRSAEGVWVVGVAVSLIGFASAAMRRRLYRGWMYASYPVAWTISCAILAVIYFAVAAPIALVLRALRRDPMLRKFDRASESYWIRREPNRNRARYFRQF